MSYQDQAIQEFVDSLKVQLPSDVKTLISLCNRDLVSGPVYLDNEGEPCDPFDFDETPTRFDFASATAKIEAAVDGLDIDTVYYETWSGVVVSSMDDDAMPGDYIEIDSRTVLEGLVGDQLVEYVH